jgi:cyclophilin family peptidyl-prolyl cis-trans isomerase
MRILPSFLVLVIALAGRLFAQNSDPITVTGTIPNKSIVQPVGTPPIDLRSFFAVPTITGRVVQFTTAGVGTFNAEMNAAAAPLTVANFLAYVNANRLANTLVHRSDQPLGIIQGGGYIPNTAGTTFASYNQVQANTAITLETTDTRLNVRGALSMARAGYTASLTVTNSSTASNTVTVNAASLPAGFGPAWGLLGSFVQSVSGSTVTLVGNANQTIASATTVVASNNTGTSEWFINTADNSGTLPPASSGGYAAYGRVTGTGMTVVDAIQALPVLGGDITVTQSSTSSSSITADGTTLPANFGTNWVLLGRQVTSVNMVGSNAIIGLSGTADRNIFSPTTVHYGMFLDPFLQLPVFHNVPSFGTGNINLTELIKMTSITEVSLFPATPGGAAVVTFSAASSNPGVVNASVSGSYLYVVALANLTTGAPVTITVTATDTNGNTAQTQFNVTVTRKVVDFNADGTTDFVFQNNFGQLYEWNMNPNGSIASSAYLFTNGLADWKLKAIADLNGDGIPDFIFQNTFGQIYAWYLTATGSISSSGYIFTNGLADWKIAGTVDLDSDGKTDLVFQNNAGQIYVWLMNGSGGIASSGYYFTSGLGDWRIVAIADVNGDGYPDFIFQNSIGQIYVWYTTVGGAVSSSAYLYGGALGDWKIARATDLNKDGTTDLIFQNNAGQISVWFLTAGGSTSSAGFLFTSGLADWRLH